MASELRKGRKRVSVDIPSALHDKIKKIAFENNTTMTELFFQAIIEYLNHYKKK